MEENLLEKTLIEEYGYTLDLAIKSFTDLHLTIAASNPPQQLPLGKEEEDDTDTSKILNRAGWVECLVGEMSSATNLDDARGRAARVLDAFEKSVSGTKQQEENLKQQKIEAVIQENSILKRAVFIQYERQKELDRKVEEMEQLKQTAARYQEKVRTLEVNNYALAMHLKQAGQQGSDSIVAGRFHGDVF